MQKYGIHGQMYNWIKEFLANREQTVVVEGVKSTFHQVISGVPQGTVLGPILFILYINDLVDILLHSQGLNFADDTKLAKAIKDLQSVSCLQQDLYHVLLWSAHNNMKLHEQKFEVLNYTLNNSALLRELPFTAECRQYSTSKSNILDPGEVVKDLGVTLSSNRSWTHHIQSAVHSARTMAAWIFSAFRDRTPTLLMTLFKSLVRSRLEYCCAVWNPAKVADIKSLEDVQRMFTRRVIGCQQLNYWERLTKLKLMSLQRRRERYCIIHVWKMLHGMAPNDIDMQFNNNPRLGMKAIFPTLNTKSQSSVRSDYENSFRINAARLWNTLPKEVNSSKTMESLKSALGKFLESFPDTPPVTGYVATNKNSLLDWSIERSAHKMLSS